MQRTVLIVDDHEDFRRVACALLEHQGFEVVGEAVDGRSAIEQARALRPAVVLLDVHLPDIDGFEVAARVLEDVESPAIVLTSSRAASAYRRRAESMDVGFVAKAELSGASLSTILA